MERILLPQGNTKGVAMLAAVAKAIMVLRAGGVILYPTDTLYGLGVDTFNEEALLKLYAIKGRSEEKPVHSIVADLEMAERYADVSAAARKLAERFLPGPLTLLLQKKDSVPDFALRGSDLFGIRIPENEFCLALARAFDAPYTTTSANKSGLKPERNVDAILEQLGEAGNSIDLIIDAGELPERAPSSVVEARGEKAILVREGAISKEELRPFL